MRTLLTIMLLAAAVLPALGQAQTTNICNRTLQVRDAIMRIVDANDCAAVDSASMAGVTFMSLNSKLIYSLAADDFDGLTSLEYLSLDDNRLTSLPAGVFDSLTSLEYLSLGDNQLTSLPAGVFDSLASLEHLSLGYNQLTSLPAGVFDDLTSLEYLSLNYNQLTSLPAGVFNSLTSLEYLYLSGNQLSALPASAFNDLTNLQELWLNRNRLTTLPAGIFDGLVSLLRLYLERNQLRALPVRVFDGLTSLRRLWLWENHLVGLTQDDPLFSGLPSVVDLRLYGQSEAPGQQATRLAAAVPLMIEASDSMRQGFVRIINKSEDSGSVRIFAFDDGGYAPNPIEIQLGANQTFHFNSNDLENGNANKGIEGIGSPVQGDWRLDIETALAVQALAFVRTTDGFLTAMHDTLPRDDLGRLVTQTFNPGSNANQVSKLRLVNTGANPEGITIEGVDDRGNAAPPVTLALAAGESRTLSAQDLENGAQGFTGMLDNGAGKWRLFITAGESVVGVSLLESASGHLTNISTMGVAVEGQ